MPDHTATDNRGEVHLLSETAAVLLVGEEIHGQRQTAPGQYRDQTLVSERTDETIERRGGDMPDDGAQFQTELTVHRQQGVASHLGMHPAITQDEVGQDREHRTTRGALDAPDGDPT